MISYERTNNLNADFQHFCQELDKEFWARYPDIQHNFEPYNKINESARVLMAYEASNAMGCGSFRPMNENNTIEIKRMYVKPECRGTGIAKKILLELEKWALQEGFSRSKLETGINQPEAIALYTRCGYRQIPNYPPYVGVAESICMMKDIS